MFDPDKTHIHHCIMSLGLDMHQTLAVILTFFVAICSINYGLYTVGVSTAIILFIDITIYALFILALQKFKVDNKERLILNYCLTRWTNGQATATTRCNRCNGSTAYAICNDLASRSTK